MYREGVPGTGAVKVFRWGQFLGPLLLCLVWSGCRTATPLPPADLSAPGWHVQQGQALWQPPGHRPELAGDLLLATNANGDCFLQFTKIPFPLVTARLAGSQWSIEFGEQRYSWHGHGTPPDRFLWFQLPGALRGATPRDPWQFRTQADGSWQLENARGGESLEGAFSP